MSFFRNTREAYRRGRDARYLGKDDFKYKGGFPVDVTLEEREAFQKGYNSTHMDPADEADYCDGGYDN